MHYRSQRRLKFANDVVCFPFIIINVIHHKLELLQFLEVVINSNSSLEVGVQIVLNVFSFSDFRPLAIDFFEYQALGIGFGKGVEIP